MKKRGKTLQISAKSNKKILKQKLFFTKSFCFIVCKHEILLCDRSYRLNKFEFLVLALLSVYVLSLLVMHVFLFFY